jgi:hypothetical protein
MLKTILNFFGLTMGGREFDRMAFLTASTPHSGYHNVYARKPNQHRARKNMRRTVFANRKIARGF